MTPGRISPGFWVNRRVLLTGHSGFKGAWLALTLKALGARVAGLSLEPEEPSLFTQAGVANRIDWNHFTDLGDPAAVDEVVAAVKPEIVIHFAAQSLVRRAFREPRRTFSTNVMGTVNLLESLRGGGTAHAALIATTDKVYLNLETGLPFRESDPLGGFDPYSASKAGTEFVVSAYRRYFEGNTVLAVARAGNIIGGGDWSEDRLIPDAIRAVQANQMLQVRNPASTRPWQFVLDALEGYLLLIEHVCGRRPDIANPALGAWNFGPPLDNPQVTVAQICDWISGICPSRFVWTAAPHAEGIRESRLLALDATRAQKELQWRPRLDAKAAVRATLEWYRAMFEGEDPYDLCLGQIDRHLRIEPIPA